MFHLCTQRNSPKVPVLGLIDSVDKSSVVKINFNNIISPITRKSLDGLPMNNNKTTESFCAFKFHVSMERNQAEICTFFLDYQEKQK